ncbi:hypothetical protein FOXG_20429 [Fusarium oxysporum f. sp. lycopersici 4287]|uniref:Uncharacterized protein n=2 Tax=Fusarium oxysporum TaxID=5507 RepID=A0A0J9VJF6_FUSO4|nr:hypothetical protein FOXG_20429 [Fusarium oxysporum f. sp. lycopersici 4287]EXK46528.1 hypothetical protein FOMG_00237 [Fusarium oxysporum f. sp. melonis 26406]KNB10911.1 hypothetical protein FOXG_20429 [Fusarium oxysporum f. sp. lycopersici 4287]
MSVEYMYGLSDVDRSKRAMLRTDFENPAISTGREVAFRMTTENGSVQLIEMMKYAKSAFIVDKLDYKSL